MTLTQHAPDLWSAEQVFGWQFGLTPIPVRMTVIRLPGGALIVHSPIALAALREEIARLGRVGFIVVPQTHGKFAEEAVRSWPDAQLLAAPKPPSGRESLPFARSLADEPPAAWASVVETHLVRGFRLNEVVLYHRPSRTLVIADLAVNIHRSDSRWARTFFRANDMWQRFGPSRIIRTIGVSDRVAMQQSLERIACWDVQRILPGHGDVVEDEPLTALRAGWRA